MSIHYGGSITKTGRLSRLPYEGHSYKIIVRIDKLVSFDIFNAKNPIGLSDKEIATVFGCSERALRELRKRPYYLKRRMERTTGVALNDNFSIQDTVELNRKLLRDMMPTALRVIADQIQSVPSTLAEKKHQASLALDVLDREGTFPKISRTDAHLKVDHDYSKADGVSADLLAAMGGAPQEAEPQSILEQLSISEKFSNSETLEPETQQKVMVELESMPSATEKVQ